MSIEQNTFADTRPLELESVSEEPQLPAGAIGEMSYLRVRAADVALIASISNEDDIPASQAVRILEDFEDFIDHATIDIPSIEGLSEVERTAVVASALVHDMRDQVRTQATDILIVQKEAAVSEVEELREIIDTSELHVRNRELEKEIERLNHQLSAEKIRSTRLRERLHDQALIAAHRRLEGPRRLIRSTRARGAIVLRATVLIVRGK